MTSSATITFGVAAMSVELPVRVISEANSRSGWRARHSRAKKQRRIAWGHVKSFAGLLSLVAQGGPITITLTRLIGKGGRDFDDDNLRGAFKAIRDGVADALKIDDGSKRLQWIYHQERAAKFGVRIALAAGTPELKGTT